MSAAKTAADKLDKSRKQLLKDEPHAIRVTEEDIWGGDYTTDEIPPVVQKQELAKALGLDAQATIEVTDEDKRIVDAKRKMQGQIEFDKWFMQKYGKEIYTDPVKAEWVKKVYPEFFSTRKKTIDDWIELQERMAKLSLLGVQDMEDLYLLYNMARTPGIEKYLAGLPKKEAATLDTSDEWKRTFMDVEALKSIYTPTPVTGAVSTDPATLGQWKPHNLQTQFLAAHTYRQADIVDPNVVAQIPAMGIVQNAQPYAWYKNPSGE